MCAEHRLGGEIVYEILRVVLDHRNLLEHDLAFGVDVGEQRLEHHVRHHVERHLDVVVGHARVDDRRLPRRRSVQLAPHRVEHLRDAHRVEARRSLEQQVLDEVRHPRLAPGLVTRPGADPEPERRGADAVDVLADHALTTRERGQKVRFHRGDPTPGAGGTGTGPSLQLGPTRRAVARGHDRDRRRGLPRVGAPHAAHAEARSSLARSALPVGRARRSRASRRA